VGRYKKIKHINQDADASSDGDQLTDKDLSHLLPVLKEVIKKVYPVSSFTLEIAYFIYQHAEALQEILICYQNGDINGAIICAVKIFGKELGEEILGYVCDYYTNETVDQISDVASSSVQNYSKQEIAKKVVQGTIEGVFEAVNEKIVDNISERLEKNEDE
jgi:hypothetical protein